MKVEELVLEFKRPITVDQKGCWNWHGSISTQGYAQYNLKPLYGILYRRFNGDCLPNMILRHLCSNKRCVNPSHVVMGTHTQNAIDAVLVGDRGKVGLEGYRRMVQLYDSGVAQVRIAEQLNVSRSLVSRFFLGEILSYKPEDFRKSKLRRI